MDELLTEDQEVERAKQLFREYGPIVVAGVVLGVGVLFGKQFWDDRTLNQAGQASLVWEQLRDAVEGERFNEVEETLAILETEYATTAYLDQARLAVARMHMDRNDPEAATAALNTLISDANDSYLRRLAQLRLAQIQLYQEKYDAALATLGPAENSGFDGLYHELRGDIFVARGALTDARDEYERALDVAGNGVLDRSFVQIKLDDVAGSIAAEALSAPAAEAGPVGDETPAAAPGDAAPQAPAVDE